MPRTIKFSKQFNDRFGDEVADEMIDLFNATDDSYRASLKELNADNFAVFDAKLQQRFAEQDARIDSRFATMDASIDRRFALMEASIEKRFGELGVQVERALKEQTRWMFVAWTALLIPLIAMWARR